MALWDCLQTLSPFYWILRGCEGNWVKIHPQNSPIVQFDSTPTHVQARLSTKPKKKYTNFICIRIKKNHFDINGVALSLSLK